MNNNTNSHGIIEMYAIYILINEMNPVLDCQIERCIKVSPDFDSLKNAIDDLMKNQMRYMQWREMLLDVNFDVIGIKIMII
jgi:hypothetical protein